MATMPNGELVIHDGNAHTVMFPTVDGEERARGLSPRTWVAHQCPDGVPGSIRAARLRIRRRDDLQHEPAHRLWCDAGPSNASAEMGRAAANALRSVHFPDRR